MSGTKYCSNCGSQIDEMAEICPECGVRQAPPRAHYGNTNYQGAYKEKNPALAVILSFFVVGLGQVYNGEVGKGVILFVCAVISAFLWLIYIGVVFSILIWAYALYDAYTTAQRINEGYY